MFVKVPTAVVVMSMRVNVEDEEEKSKDLFRQFDFGDRVVNALDVVGPRAFHFFFCGLDAPTDAASSDFEDERLRIVLEENGDEIHGGRGGAAHGERVMQGLNLCKLFLLTFRQFRKRSSCIRAPCRKFSL